MPIAYERATYVERLTLPRTIAIWFMVFIALAAFGGAAASWFHGVRSNSLISLLLVLGPIIGAIACAAVLTADGQIRVFVDRLEISLRVLGLPFKRYELRWPQVRRIQLATSSMVQGYSAYSWSPGTTIIMFGSAGINVRLANGGTIIVGSADPQQLLDAIAEARRSD